MQAKIILFKEYVENGFKDGGLTIFDIDDTLFHTTATINVKKDGKVIKNLTNQEFNTYKLGKGEEFDFAEFKNAEKFAKESQPIGKMLEKAKAIIAHSEKTANSKVVIITARDDFDDKEKFLDTFRKHGIDIDKVRVERAGKIKSIEGPDVKKYIIIHNMLTTKQFSRVRLFDDSITNLKTFLKLKETFPSIHFKAFFVKADGSLKQVK
jgi:FMN phosphatase YigB (HAD superfamily)